MDPKHLFLDERLKGRCTYCGGPPETVDHVPSRVLLDNPLPANLPVVEACQKCNGGFSLDEEYIACLLECTMSGTTEISELSREKIKHALARNPRLRNQLEQCRRTDDCGHIWWQPDERRVRNVIMKLARGHAAYELGESCNDQPDHYSVRAIPTMTTEEINDFEILEDCVQPLWPEIGCRAFLRASGKPVPPIQIGAWLIIQSGRYRYLVDWQDGVDVRIIIGEYLACRIVWY